MTEYEVEVVVFVEANDPDEAVEKVRHKLNGRYSGRMVGVEFIEGCVREAEE